MLTIKQRRKTHLYRSTLGILAGTSMAAGIYMLVLVSAPIVAPSFAYKPINVATLPSPEKSQNRIVIPKLGVNIPYDTGAAALDQGAEWRAPDSGNPSEGGNFVIAAHRFSIQPTPLSTVQKSPFYHIEKLQQGDKIVVDYEGTRYGYEVTKQYIVKPTQTEIEDRTELAKLTLYSCELEGAGGDRIVVEAVKLGEVALAKN